MTICHGIPWCRNGADDHCPFSIEGWWLFFYPLSYLTLTVERRLGTLKKHLEQADIYFKCKGKKPLTEAEQILFTTAKDYLKGIMNGKTTIPTKTWKEEYTKLTAERKTLNQRYLALKEEVKEAEKIRKSVYSILRQEQREQQPHRKQDMER